MMEETYEDGYDDDNPFLKIIYILFLVPFTINYVLYPCNYMQVEV